MKKEVKAGAAFLDKEYPGWYNDISLGSLNMRIPAVCICGQLHIDRMMFDVAHGFNIDDNRYSTLESQYRAFRKLRELWTDEIMMRRGVGSAVC